MDKEWRRRLAGAEWDAGDVLGTQDWNSGRSILTYDTSAHDGTPFRFSDLAAAEQASLNVNPASGNTDTQGQARLEYLRGSTKDEGNNGNNYRQRASRLGDIVDSAPFFVGAPSFRYPDSLESAPYSAFRTNNASREQVIYVGANDGMLHAFNAATGAEELAYVPGEMFRQRGTDHGARLVQLTSPTYTHRFFVDGSPSVGNVFTAGAWKTVLAGGLGGGGQGVYALDVTNPANFTEGNADNLVLWEFTDANDPDLGYTFSQPSIVKMHNGKWAAVFGNGYNNTEMDDAGACSDNNAQTPCTVSSTGHAVLYIVFIGDGTDGTWGSSDFVKIDTGAGSVATPNGLATPAAVDVDGDNRIDYVYAGDLQGNLWKFNVTSTDTSQWKVALTQGTAPAPLFVAQDANGNRQPITSRPEVGTHPDGLGGFVIYFGTGKYLENSDKSTTGPQDFYAVWDTNDPTNPQPVTRNDLLQQTVLEVVSVQQGGQTSQYRVTSDNDITCGDSSDHAIPCWRTPAHASGKLGWFLDLPTTSERSVSNPILRNQRILFTTLIPSTDVCSAGGTGWLMELDIRNGGRPVETQPFFDVNNDGIFNEDDAVHVTTFDANNDGRIDNKDTASATGRLSEVGIIPEPTVVADVPNRIEYKYSAGSTGRTEVIRNNPGPGDLGRQSWRQVY